MFNRNLNRITAILFSKGVLSWRSNYFFQLKFHYAMESQGLVRVPYKEQSHTHTHTHGKKRLHLNLWVSRLFSFTCKNKVCSFCGLLFWASKLMPIKKEGKLADFFLKSSFYQWGEFLKSLVQSVAIIGWLVQKCSSSVKVKWLQGKIWFYNYVNQFWMKKSNTLKKRRE